MNITLGLSRRGEYPEAVEAELDGIVAPMQVFLDRLNTVLSTVDSTSAVFGVPTYGPVGVTANVGARILTAAESGLIITNENDTDGSTVYLPTASLGLTFTFCLVEAQTLTIVCASQDTLRIIGSSGTQLAAAAAGNSVTLVAISPQRWLATSYAGVWSAS